MKIDFYHELKKAQKELEKVEKLGEEISKSARQSLEDILVWAKSGYQKQALREQLKHEFAKIIQENKRSLTAQGCQDGAESLKRAQRQLKDSFSSKAGKDIQEGLRQLLIRLEDSEEEIIKLQKSIQSRVDI